MTDIKFATYPYTPIKNIKDEQDIRNNDERRLQYIYITLEMPFINCEIELILTWSRDCVIIYTDVNNQVPTITITETNLYVPVVTLSSQDNAKLIKK